MSISQKKKLNAAKYDPLNFPSGYRTKELKAGNHQTEDLPLRIYGFPIKIK